MVGQWIRLWVFSAAVGTLAGLHWQDTAVSVCVTLAVGMMLSYIDKYLFILLTVRVLNEKEKWDASNESS